MIAEDDPFIARMYQTKFKLGGYEALIVGSGREAYDQIKSAQPDLVLLDLSLPEVSGFEILSMLEQDKYDFKDRPVMVITNATDQAGRAKVSKYGIEYLVKADLTPRQVLDKANAKLGIKPANV